MPKTPSLVGNLAEAFLKLVPKQHAEANVPFATIPRLDWIPPFKGIRLQAYKSQDEAVPSWEY